MLKSVYIIGFGKPQVVKIGVAREPLKRMRLVASDLGVNFTECWNYISSLQKDPHLIENRCHKALSEYCLGGFGPKKLYPRETFQCSLEKARSILEKIIEDYEERHPRLNRSSGMSGLLKDAAKCRKDGPEAASEEDIRVEHLRIIMHSNGWTNGEMAKRMGISARTIEAYFGGERVVPEKITLTLGRE
ncbi:MAG TPA: hypothetical protein DHV36_12445 [Desulfobacteraceae bacterium]|nr:hypothetical protein [Desulfobacteraceae bacterium]